MTVATEPGRAAPWRVEHASDDVVLLHSSDTRPRPADWRDRLTETLRTIGGVAMVGARRMMPDGRLFSMGELIVHPKGFHHLGHGLDGRALRFAEEVDAVCGGVAAIDRGRFERITGATPGAVSTDAPVAWCELSLDVRRSGGRVVTTPDVQIESTASPTTNAAVRAAFRERQGFDLLAADLQEVRRRNRGNGLLWNARFHGPAPVYDKYDDRGPLHWESYRTVEVYRRRADHLVEVIARLAGGGRALDLGCGDGLFAHLLARRGIEVTGLEPEAIAVAQAETAIGGHEYPGPRPRFARRGGGEAMPFEPGAFGTVAMLDVIEHLPNPVAVLRECRRVLSPGGHLLVTTPSWQPGGSSDPAYHVCEFTEGELSALVTHAAGLQVDSVGHIGGAYRDIVLVARRS